MSLEDKLLQVPAAPRTGQAAVGAPTTRIDIMGEKASVEIKSSDPATEGEAREALERQGLDPDRWTVTGVRTSSWTMANGEEGTSKKFSFAPAIEVGGLGVDMDELIDYINDLPTTTRLEARPEPAGAGVIVPIGDMQFGKQDGEHVEGVEDSVTRTLRVIDQAAAQIAEDRPDRPHIVVAWLGDHIEGFVSQGGANTWRTKLTLNEQIRLLRRVMMYAVEAFAPVAGKLTMAAVPGNHGEPQRFMGTGITRYDDSHDTEALIAVSEACTMRPDLFGHVEFYVPDTDELTVAVEVAGTRVALAHGHKHRIGKHFEWWKGQEFHGNAVAGADLLICGHYHTFLLDTEGKRSYVQIPALETESTWFRHMRGVKGDPGLLMLSVHEGQLLRVEVVR